MGFAERRHGAEKGVERLLRTYEARKLMPATVRPPSVDCARLWQGGGPRGGEARRLLTPLGRGFEGGFCLAVHPVRWVCAMPAWRAIARTLTSGTAPQGGLCSKLTSLILLFAPLKYGLLPGQDHGVARPECVPIP